MYIFSGITGANTKIPCGYSTLDSMMILTGSTSHALGSRLAAALGAPTVDAEIRRFPDKEAYVRILSDVSGRDVCLVQNLYPDEGIVEFILLCDALREAGARNIIGVVPYFGYARQDRIFNPGEAVSARAVARIVEPSIDDLITVDLHKSDNLSFFSIPTAEISAAASIGAFFKARAMECPLVVSPDKGAAQRAETVASVMGCDWTFLNKKRLDAQTVVIDVGDTAVEGRDVLIVDDIISTGGTVARAATLLKERGAQRVYVACTHGLFADDARAKIVQAGCDELFSTDTLENDAETVSIAGALATELKKRLQK